MFRRGLSPDGERPGTPAVDVMSADAKNGRPDPAMAGLMKWTLVLAMLPGLTLPGGLRVLICPCETPCLARQVPACCQEKAREDRGARAREAQSCCGCFELVLPDHEPRLAAQPGSDVPAPLLPEPSQSHAPELVVLASAERRPAADPPGLTTRDYRRPLLI